MHRITICLLTLIVMGLPCLPAGGQERGLEFRTDDNRLIPVYKKSYAVVIGINRYRKWSTLNYAVADAKSVRERLLTLGFADEHIIMLLDDQATKERIEALLGDELRRRVDDEDRVFIYFAGHGQTEEVANGDQEGYIVPVDGDAKQPFSTSISMTTVRRFSERLPAKHVFYAIDACYSGLALMRSGESDPRDKGYIDKITRSTARQILTGGAAGEQVVERDGHGVFTQTLLTALDGTADRQEPFGVITATELGAYLQPTVSVLTNNAQTPQFGRLSPGEGDFLFILPERASILASTLTGSLLLMAHETCMVTVDDKPIGRLAGWTPKKIALEKGEHLVTATNMKGLRWTGTVVVEAERQKVMEIAFDDRISSSPPAPQPDEPKPPSPLISPTYSENRSRYTNSLGGVDPVKWTHIFLSNERSPRCREHVRLTRRNSGNA